MNYMDPRHLFIDERHFGTCVYCGAEPSSRDHVPPKIFLDKPYPPDLPVVDACTRCNAGFSLDEQYFACFVEAARCGTTEPSNLGRTKIGRILTDNPRLKQRIEKSRTKDEKGILWWQPEVERIRRVIIKLARGHVAYELYPQFDEPRNLFLYPIGPSNNGELKAFTPKQAGDYNIFPEIGSRAFMRLFSNKKNPEEKEPGWILIQPRRYKYKVSELGRVVVRIAFGDSLATEVSWAKNNNPK